MQWYFLCGPGPLTVSYRWFFYVASNAQTELQSSALRSELPLLEPANVAGDHVVSGGDAPFSSPSSPRQQSRDVTGFRCSHILPAGGEVGGMTREPTA